MTKSEAFCEPRLLYIDTESTETMYTQLTDGQSLKVEPRTPLSACSPPVQRFKEKSPGTQIRTNVNLSTLHPRCVTSSTHVPVSAPITRGAMDKRTQGRLRLGFCFIFNECVNDARISYLNLRSVSYQHSLQPLPNVSRINRCSVCLERREKSWDHRRLV